MTTSTQQQQQQQQQRTRSSPLAPGGIATPGRERIWYEDPKGFMRDDRLTHFVPESHTGLDAQLNAIMRFSLYLAVFVALYRRQLMPALTIVAAAAAVTYAVRKGESERTDAADARVEALELQLDPATQQLCSRPTLNNPYMNVLMSDYGRFPERPGACDITRKSVRDRAEDLANHDLYVDSDDVYGRRANSSQFHTTPSCEIPNKRDSLVRWLNEGNVRGSCREANGSACQSKVYSHYPGV